MLCQQFLASHLAALPVAWRACMALQGVSICIRWKWRLYHQPPSFLWLRLISCYRLLLNTSIILLMLMSSKIGALLPFCFYVPLQKIRFCLRNVNCIQTPKPCALYSWSVIKLQIFFTSCRLGIFFYILLIEFNFNDK